MSEKQHAKEYLYEFSKYQDNWLKALIYDAIETNGDIKDDRKREMFSSLITGAGINLTEPTTTNKKLNDEIYLTELTHMSGVNALKENQTIKFSNNVTILYGLNGAGKSSYFKVLNEIVGGNQKRKFYLISILISLRKLKLN